MRAFHILIVCIILGVTGFYSNSEGQISIISDDGEFDYVYTATEGADVFLASNEDDLIYALGGDDFIFDRVGSDKVYAGEGNDIIRSGPGTDLFDGGMGIDTLFYDFAAFTGEVDTIEIDLEQSRIFNQIVLELLKTLFQALKMCKFSIRP